MDLATFTRLSPLRSAQVTAVGVFVIDVFTPQGMAPYMFYAVSVLVAARSRQQEPVIMLGYICTLLTAVGAAFSPGAAHLWTIVFNRIATVLLIWTMVVLCLPSERRKGDRR
jgi:cyanate permease